MKIMKSIIVVALIAALFTVCLAEAAPVDTSDWKYYTFEGSGIAMKIPADFEAVTDEPEEGIFYNCGNDDIVLQVTPVEGDYADREALAAYYDAQEYIVKAEPVEINGVELVYIEGGDDCITAYAVISPEGTIYCFTFYPLLLDNEDSQGIEIAEAMAETICSSEDVPEE